MKMTSWANLHHDLIILIARKIDSQEDYLAIRGVCPSWRAAATKENFHRSDLPQVPLLMFPENKGSTDVQEIHSLYKGNKIRMVTVLDSVGKLIFESRGWLVTVEANGCMNLLHPFSDAHFQLPRYHLMRTNILKVIASRSPSDDVSDLEIMILEQHGENDMYTWRYGDKAWTKVLRDNVWEAEYIEVAYLSGIKKTFIRHADDSRSESEVVFTKLYSVNSDRDVELFNMNVRYSLTTVIFPKRLAVLPKCPRSLNGARVSYDRVSYYIVEISDSSLVVVRMYYLSGEECEKFQVFEVGFRKGMGFGRRRWREIVNLGDKVIFLNNSSSSTLVKVSTIPGKVEPNNIYFIKGNSESGSVVCVYNLEDQSIKPYYKVGSYPLIFVTPSFY